MHSANAERLHPAADVDVRHFAAASAGKPNAFSDAPGLQKHPPRTDTRISLARSSTLAYGTDALSRRAR
jgi:hypothetical protein